MDIINAAGMDETYSSYVDDECLDIHDYDDDTDHETDEDIDDDTDDGGRGNRRPFLGAAVHVPSFPSSPHPARGVRTTFGIWVPSGRGNGRG